MDRSENMRRIRSKNSSPEILARQIVHDLGYRFRLHRADLPGKPDMVLPRLRSVIFMHGCFWHSHRNCAASHIPKSNVNYWKPKLERNKRRDETVRRALRRLGWRVLVLWECQIAKPDRVAEKVRRFLR